MLWMPCSSHLDKMQCTPPPCGVERNYPRAGSATDYLRNKAMMIILRPFRKIPSPERRIVVAILEGKWGLGQTLFNWLTGTGLLISSYIMYTFMEFHLSSRPARTCHPCFFEHKRNHPNLWEAKQHLQRLSAAACLTCEEEHSLLLQLSHLSVTGMVRCVLFRSPSTSLTCWYVKHRNIGCSFLRGSQTGEVDPRPPTRES